MKKLIIVSLALLGSQLADAAILRVINDFNKAIAVVVVGSDNNFNSLNAQTIKPGEIGTFGCTGGAWGPMRFAFIDEMNAALNSQAANPTYTVFETMSSLNHPDAKDPDYSKLTTDAERRDFTLNKATGYGRAYNNETFPLWPADIKELSVSLDQSGSVTYTAPDGSIKRGPVVRQVNPMDAWWQPRRLSGFRTRNVAIRKGSSGQQLADW